MNRLLPFVGVLAASAGCARPLLFQSGDGGSTGFVGGVDANAPDAGFVPATRACVDATTCLSGFVNPIGFIALPRGAKAALFSSFPSGTDPVPNAEQDVAKDGRWAFDGLLAGSRYFVRITAEFYVPPSRPSAIARIVGPLSAAATNVQVDIRPVQIQAFELQTAGSATSQLQSVSAHVFDPATGVEIPDLADAGSDASAPQAVVDVRVGGVSVPMPWSNQCGGLSYCAQFSPLAASQPTYLVSAVLPAVAVPDAAAVAPSNWLLAGQVSTVSDGGITAPAAGASVSADAALPVTWAVGPEADFEVVDLFVLGDGGYQTAYVSPRPNGPSVSSESISVVPSGSYFLEVVYGTAMCPAGSDAGSYGCVLGSRVFDETFTAK